MRGSGRLTEHRDFIRIAAEGGNVVLHPAQCENHVAQTEVGGHSLDFKKSVHVHTVVDGDEHNPVLRKGGTVETHVVVVAAGAAAAGNIDHDRALGLAGSGGPDVQTQAVSAADGLVLSVRLQRNVAELDGVDDTVPGLHGFGQSQAVFSFIRRHAAGNASEDMHSVHDKPPHAAFCRFDDGAFRGMGMKRHGAHERHGRASI